MPWWWEIEVWFFFATFRLRPPAKPCSALALEGIQIYIFSFPPKTARWKNLDLFIKPELISSFCFLMQPLMLQCFLNKIISLSTSMVLIKQDDVSHVSDVWCVDCIFGGTCCVSSDKFMSQSYLDQNGWPHQKFCVFCLITNTISKELKYNYDTKMIGYMMMMGYPLCKTWRCWVLMESLRMLYMWIHSTVCWIFLRYYF